MAFEYQQLKGVDEVANFVDTDRVLVVTADGIRQTTRQAVLGALGGADIVDWDARASRIAVGAAALPFRRSYLLPNAAASVTSVPTVDVSGKTVTKLKTSTDGLEQALWTLRGSLPETGTHWVAFEAQCSDASSIHRIYIGRQTVHGLVGSQTGDCVGVIEITGTQIKAKRFDTNAESTVALTNATQKVMLQISPTDITAYATAGFVFSFGARPAEDLLIGGQIYCSADVDQTLVINNSDDSTIPRTPDAGYVGLSLLDSVVPANMYPTDIVYARTPSVYRDQLLMADVFYMLAANEETIAIIDQTQVATLANENRFQKSVGFDNDYVLMGRIDAYDQQIVYGGPRNNLFNFLYNQPELSESTVVFGKALSSFNGSYVWNTYVLGEAFNGLAGNMDVGDLVGIGMACNALSEASSYGIAIGTLVAPSLISLNRSVLLGDRVLNVTPGRVGTSLFIGSRAGANKTAGTGVGENNVVLGVDAFSLGPLGGSNDNVAVGRSAMAGGVTLGTVLGNTAVGKDAMLAYEGSPNYNTAVGMNAMRNTNNVQESTAVGMNAGSGLKGSGNVAIGINALSDSLDNQINCTAVGNLAMQGLGAVTNSTAIGYQASVTGSNQLQLGNSSTTTYSYGAVQSRSDLRDKTSIRNTELGLNFILALRPVDYQWDYREDYITHQNKPVEPAPLYAEPKMDPTIAKDDPRYDSFYDAYLTARQQWQLARDYREKQMDDYRDAYAEWLAQSNLANVVKDGSKRRSRFHHGFIAQEVKQKADELGVDFGGFQDHSLAGGKDVKSLGYEEFIGPLVRSVQELNEKFTDAEVINQIADRVLDKIANDPDNALIDIIAERMLAKMAAARRV